MADLQLYGQPAPTVFHLLGSRENDLTFALGWALVKSPQLLSLLVSELGAPTREPAEAKVSLQERTREAGITDVVVATAEGTMVVVEAKKGWDPPTKAQLQRYQPFIADAIRVGGASQGILVSLAQCSRADASAVLPALIGGTPVEHLQWRRLSEIVRDARRQTTPHREKQVLDEFNRYLRSVMTMQTVTSNRVFVVVVGRQTVPDSSVTWLDIVERGRYFHPVGHGWPHEPPNYIAFRWDGRLQRIHHVEKVERIEDLHEAFPEIPSKKEAPRFLYQLGPAIEPTSRVSSKGTYRNGRVWAALDLLLTSSTIAEASEETRRREATAGL